MLTSMTHNDRFGSLRTWPSTNLGMFLYSRYICISVFLVEVLLVCSGQCEIESQRHIVGSPIVSNLQPANTQAGCWIHRLFVFLFENRLLPCMCLWIFPFTSISRYLNAIVRTAEAVFLVYPCVDFFICLSLSFFLPLNATCPYT